MTDYEAPYFKHYIADFDALACWKQQGRQTIHLNRNGAFGSCSCRFARFSFCPHSIHLLSQPRRHQRRLDHPGHHRRWPKRSMDLQPLGHSGFSLNLVLIQGKVLNKESGEPEAAVDIQVLLPNQGSYQQTVSAEDGSFSLLLWGDTSYTFTYNKEGFMRQQKSEAARALSLPVVLTPVITEQPEIPEETETPKDSLLHLNNQWF